MELEPEGRKLYRFEHYEPLDDSTYVDWVWLTPEEVPQFRRGDGIVKYREATEDESYLYNEAYADGYGIASIMEFESKYDGITYRVELNEDGDFSEGTKMFQCSICKEHKDFESEVAMANGFYLTELNNENLWHVCYRCVMMDSEFTGVTIEFNEEGEENS